LQILKEIINNLLWKFVYNAQCQLMKPPNVPVKNQFAITAVPASLDVNAVVAKKNRFSKKKHALGKTCFLFSHYLLTIYIKYT